MALDDARMNKQLLKLDPQTRLEQTCDTEVMLRLNKDKRSYSVDKVIAYAFKDTTFGKDAISAPGAVFRSRGEWYHLAYKCVTGPQHLDAQSLNYRIGGKVPKEQWETYYLYD